MTEIPVNTVLSKKSKPRVCVACRKLSPKKELLRVVRKVDGTIEFDITGKTQGRGAYICADRQCISDARKKRTLQRSLKTKADNSIYDILEKYLEERTVTENAEQ